MHDLRLSFGAGPEAEFAEHFQHRGILGQDLGDQFLQPCVARKVSQMTHEGRSDPLSLTRIDHDEGYFDLARLDNDVTPTSNDRRPPVLIQLCDKRNVIVEIDVHEKSELGFRETALRRKKRRRGD
jgi:hypothetical protein